MLHSVRIMLSVTFKLYIMAIKYKHSTEDCESDGMKYVFPLITPINLKPFSNGQQTSSGIIH